MTSTRRIARLAVRFTALLVVLLILSVVRVDPAPNAHALLQATSTCQQFDAATTRLADDYVGDMQGAQAAAISAARGDTRWDGLAAAFATYSAAYHRLDYKDFMASLALINSACMPIRARQLNTTGVGQ